MDFTFTEDQLLFQESVRDFLVNEVTADSIRQLWDTETGRSDVLWRQLAELGLTGLTVPEDCGGLGMSAVDFVLLAQECGYVALPEPLVHNALLSVPVLEAIGGELAQEWLPKIASGDARVVVALQSHGLAEDAHVADLILLQRGAVIHALEPAEVTLRFNESVDPSRRLYAVEPQLERPVLDDAAVVEGLLNRGALGCAAQCLGLAQRMIDMTVHYTADRQQFGKPIGSFQAVKHQMANVAVRLEYARAPVHRAAQSISSGSPDAALHVSHAKLMACEAANLAAKNSIQCHGAMGYTWEVDLHIFMKRAWALASSYGDTGFHKQRVAAAVLDGDIALGAGSTFL